MSLTYTPTMNKKFLSILLSASIIASSASSFVYAAPTPVTSFDTAFEEVSDVDNITDAPVVDETALETEAPNASDCFDTAMEQNTEFGVPDFTYTASLSADFLLGAGTEESPYLISNADELMLFSANINQGVNSGSYYELTSDIDLGGAEWTPIGHMAEKNDYSRTFHGVFNGNGYTVSNLKITSNSTSHVGFFGHIYEGTVKKLNLDNVTISLNTDLTSSLYVGTLAGRIVTVNGENGGQAEISSCNVTNSTLTVASKGTIYAGGLCGSAISGKFTHENDSTFILAMNNTDCDINVSSSSSNKVNLAIGGLIGYLGAENGSSMKVLNCNTYGSITSDSTSTSTITTIAGGVFGLIMTFNATELGGEMRISSCHSEGDIMVASQVSAYAGGISGQISASNITTIKDCYSSANITGKSIYSYTVLGGFMGMTDYYQFSSQYGNNTLFNCYSSGDIIDITYQDSKKGTSYVGAFVGYTPVGIFNNCYKLESQKVLGSDLSVDDIKIMPTANELNMSSYVGFDFDKTWQMNVSSSYPYPTLTKKTGYVTFINQGVFLGNDVFGIDGKIPVPSLIPEKEPTIDKYYAFAHWSLTQDGDAFDFNQPVYENITLYAVFASSPRYYKVNFISNGEKYIQEASIVFGGNVIVPDTIPTKEPAGRYYYEFSHWAIEEDGDNCNPSEFSVNGDLTFYAVFTEFDKNMWTGNVASSFASGYGTQEMPYMIERAEELAFMQKVINQKVSGYENAHFALADDINLGGNYWAPIGTSKEIPFTGSFNGNGFRISNYKVLDNQYAGLFGYVKNAVIKNVYLADFEIDFTLNTDETELKVYVGGVAGFFENVSYDGEISGIRISADKFNINSNAFHIYAGGIIGCGTARSKGTTTIHDCFVTSPISITATSGYAYTGGIAARLETTSASISKIVNCYNIGDVSSTSKMSSWAGGLVGYLYSTGSAYIGAPVSEDASLSAFSDKDTMIIGSFVLANISAESETFEYVGYIAGLITDYADTYAVLYTGEKTLSGKNVQNAGTKMASKYFLDKDFLFEEMGFDFENTWTYLSSKYAYPVLKCMVSDKPGVKILSATHKDDKLDLSVQAYTDSGEYIVVIGIYTARNQMISFEKIPSEGFVEIDVSYDGMKQASYVKISAISSKNFKPLFEEVSQDI